MGEILWSQADRPFQRARARAAVRSSFDCRLIKAVPELMTKMPGLMTNRHQRRAFGGERRTVAVGQLTTGSAT